MKKYGVKEGWYQGDNDNRYYFDSKGQLLRNTTAVIGGNKYAFDNSGLATLVEGVDYGRVVIEHVDQNDNPVKENDTFVEKTEVGTQSTITIKQKLRRLISTRRIKTNMRLYRLTAKLSISN